MRARWLRLLRWLARDVIAAERLAEYRDGYQCGRRSGFDEGVWCGYQLGWRRASLVEQTRLLAHAPTLERLN